MTLALSPEFRAALYRFCPLVLLECTTLAPLPQHNSLLLIVLISSSSSPPSLFKAIHFHRWHLFGSDASATCLRHSNLARMTLKRQLDGSEDHLPLKRIRRAFAHFPMSLSKVFRIGEYIHFLVEGKHKHAHTTVVYTSALQTSVSLIVPSLLPFAGPPINVRDNTAPLGRQESCASCSQKIDSPNAKQCTFCERPPCGDCELVCFKCNQIYCGLCAIRTYSPLHNSAKCLSCR